MKPPILLPFHTPYEVALSNIYFKQEFYQILANDEESSIQIVFYVLKGKPDIATSAGFSAEIIDQKILDNMIGPFDLINRFRVTKMDISTFHF